MNEKDVDIQAPLFSIEEAFLEAESEQKALVGCDLCQHCFLIRSMLLHRALGSNEGAGSLMLTKQQRLNKDDG